MRRAAQSEQWLTEYDQHLSRVCGSADATRYIQGRFARLFIEQRFGTEVLDWSAVAADDIVRFVTGQAAARQGFGRKKPGNAIRSMLRFLVTSGAVADGLQAAVPRVRQWKHAALPRKLTPDQVEQVLATPSGMPATWLRNRAILMLLARLGLRAKEIVDLELDAVDWSEAQIRIKSTKTHSERVLPLAQEVGAALVEYLQKARPETISRRIFIGASGKPFASASPVSALARRALLRIGGLKGPRLAAHTFRHTAASMMVQSGATFKQTADVLGHRSLTTTAIYAKLDVASLAAVALPWQGGSL